MRWKEVKSKVKVIIIIIIIIIIIFAFVSRRNVVTSEAAPVTV